MKPIAPCHRWAIRVIAPTEAAVCAAAAHAANAARSGSASEAPAASTAARTSAASSALSATSCSAAWNRFRGRPNCTREAACATVGSTRRRAAPRERLAVALPEAHVLAAGPDLDLGDLAEQPFGAPRPGARPGPSRQVTQGPGRGPASPGRSPWRQVVRALPEPGTEPGAASRPCTAYARKGSPPGRTRQPDAPRPRAPGWPGIVGRR
nr:hypothetical protein [Streptomyces sp. VRA16 Mangrove soil]